jgi:hypothetical protein
VRDVRNVQASRRDIRGNQDWSSPGSERLQRSFSLLLRAVTVNGCRRFTLLAQKVLQLIGASLRFNKHKGQTRDSFRQIQKHLSLVVIRWDIADRLIDEFGGRTNATNG